VLCVGTAACSIPTDDAPRAIPEEDRVGLDDQEEGDPAVGSNLIFLLAPTLPGEPAQLRAVQRDVSSTAAALLQSLYSGPNTEEIAEGIGTAVPADLELHSVSTVQAVLTVDMSDSLAPLTVDAVTLAVAQIVATVSELDSVRAVRILINGEDQVWPLGNGGLADRALTIYDYPGMVESSQPAYPAIPSADA
jgi:hypothetical protein